MRARGMAMMVATLMAGCMLMAPGASAAAVEADSPYVNLALRKLGRGVANIVTGPGEIIRKYNMVSREDGVLAGTTVGVLQGLWRTLLREVVGVIEVVTFFAEIPDNFEPMITPEFVFAHGSWTQDENRAEPYSH